MTGHLTTGYTGRVDIRVLHSIERYGGRVQTCYQAEIRRDGRVITRTPRRRRREDAEHDGERLARKLFA
jgi:hypothetical protein